jgi:hypothetical protein
MAGEHSNCGCHSEGDQNGERHHHDVDGRSIPDPSVTHTPGCCGGGGGAIVTGSNGCCGGATTEQKSSRPTEERHAETASSAP